MSFNQAITSNQNGVKYDVTLKDINVDSINGTPISTVINIGNGTADHVPRWNSDSTFPRLLDSDVIIDGYGNITSKSITIDGSPGYTLPSQDGSAGQVMTTDGGGNVTFENNPFRHYIFVCFSADLDITDGFDLTQCLISSGLATYDPEAEYVEIGCSSSTAVTGGTVTFLDPNSPFNYRVEYSEQMIFDQDNGQITVAKAGLYKIDYSVVLRRTSGTGDRVHYISVGVNGIAPALSNCSTGANEIAGTDWTILSGHTMIELSASDTVSLWYAGVNLGGVALNDVHISQIQFSVTEI